MCAQEKKITSFIQQKMSNYCIYNTKKAMFKGQLFLINCELPYSNQTSGGCLQAEEFLATLALGGIGEAGRLDRLRFSFSATTPGGS